MHAPDLADASRHLASIWASLVGASGSRDAPFRTPTLATAGIDGSAQARTVVLRAATPASRELFIYADARSPKVAEIQREPRATLSFWDPATQVQIRASGRCNRLNDPATVKHAWDAVPESNRLNYRTTLPPGSEIISPEAMKHEGDGFANFAVLVLAVDAFDWLWLDRAGHKRCRFDLSRGQSDREWLVP